MISYAQNAEDVRLERVFRDVPKGFYIDVGAADPTDHSVTRHLYDRGWRGVNIEPHRPFFELLVRERPEDVNLEIALSDREGTLPLYEQCARDGGATLSDTVAESRRAAGDVLVSREVRVSTLGRICEEHVRDRLDLVKIDVEGAERQVLLGADWQRWRADVVVVEATLPHSKVPSHHLWEDVLLENGYLMAAFDGLNRYYVPVERSSLVAVLEPPISIFDEHIPHRFQSVIEDLRNRLALAEAAVAATPPPSGENGHAALAQARAILDQSSRERADLSLRLEAALAATQRLRARALQAEAALAGARAELEAAREGADAAAPARTAGLARRVSARLLRPRA
jgi:FkbM family methyltransferase